MMLLRSVCLALLIPGLAQAQYEKYSFRSFPQKDIMPLESAYNYALEQYAAQNWAESVKYLELSLRLHRLLRDSEAFCSRNCSSVSRDNVTLYRDVTLRVAQHVLLRAACLKRCKEEFPVFKLKYPRRDLLQAFEERIPYRYIQFAYYQVRFSSAKCSNTIMLFKFTLKAELNYTNRNKYLFLNICEGYWLQIQRTRLPRNNICNKNNKLWESAVADELSSEETLS